MSNLFTEFKEKTEAAYHDLMADVKSAQGDARIESHQNYEDFKNAQSDFDEKWNTFANASEDKVEAAQHEAQSAWHSLKAKWESLKSNF